MAHGWPRSEAMTAPMSTTVYATTTCKTQPNMPPIADVKTMARGEATSAIAHSSLRWNGASKPDIAHMTLMKLINIAIPFGKSVPFSIVPQTCELGANLGSVVVPAGMRMMTIITATMLKEEPKELNMAIHLVGMLLMQLWTSMRRVVSRNSSQFVAV